MTKYIQLPDKNKGKKVEVCYSPLMLPLFDLTHSTVVVMDVFRATSAICTGFAHGIDKIIPIESLQEAEDYKKRGFIVAAERNGQIVNGYNFGNSPYSFMDSKLKGKTVVITTTNGTHAINKAKKAKTILIGSFLNLNAIVNYLKNSKDNIILLCAGWQDKFNLEDTLLAGAISSMISLHLTDKCDAAIAAENLYKDAASNLKLYLSNSSHAKRLIGYGIEKDIDFCLQNSIFDLVPYISNDVILPNIVQKQKTGYSQYESKGTSV